MRFAIEAYKSFRMLNDDNEMSREEEEEDSEGL